MSTRAAVTVAAAMPVAATSRTVEAARRRHPGSDARHIAQVQCALGQFTDGQRPARIEGSEQQPVLRAQEQEQREQGDGDLHRHGRFDHQPRQQHAGRGGDPHPGQTARRMSVCGGENPQPNVDGERGRRQR